MNERSERPGDSGDNACLIAMEAILKEEPLTVVRQAALIAAAVSIARSTNSAESLGAILDALAGHPGSTALFLLASRFWDSTCAEIVREDEAKARVSTQEDGT